MLTGTHHPRRAQVRDVLRQEGYHADVDATSHTLQAPPKYII